MLKFDRVSLQGRLDSVEFELQGDQKTALLGSSGAGKSTLIALANGSLQADQGQVLWTGQPICQLPRRRPVSYTHLTLPTKA